MDFATAKLLTIVTLLGFTVLEIVAGRFMHTRTSTWRDAIIDASTSLALPLVAVPAIFTAAPYLAEVMVPGGEGWLAALPAWVMFGILLFADDLTQYWWHRLSHTSWLYPLHRAHHSGRYLSVRVVYRNHLVYYLLMPGLWLSAVLVYWGFGVVYGVYILLKMSIIIGAHSSVPWDAPLYVRFPRLMWVVERVISTPATHSAHHGRHADDGVTHYKGNYGNLLFIWDVLFGTAHITRRRPDTFGIEHLEPVRLVDELLWLAPAVPTSPAAVAESATRSERPLVKG